jgi:hypothetical protein
MLELVVSEVPAIEKIKSNLLELKKEIKPQLELYKNTIYTEETIKNAKEDRAKLNKLEKAINDKKIEITKLFNKPLEEYVAESKEASSLIKEAIVAIDSQVKTFEKRQKDEKLKQIEEFFSENIGELVGLLKFADTYNEKWLNATYKMSDIEEEIKTVISKTTADLVVIVSLKSEFDMQLKDYYLQKLDLSATLMEKIRLEKQKEKLEELKQKQEEEKKASNIVNTMSEVIAEKVAEELQQIDFRVQITEKQKILLREFLKNNSIKYGFVPIAEYEEKGFELAKDEAECIVNDCRNDGETDLRAVRDRIIYMNYKEIIGGN